MADANWIGGTTAVTHVMTGTITLAWANSDVIKTRIWDENGVEQLVTTTVTGFVDIENQVRDPHLSDLQNSTLSKFAAITWTSSGTGAIVATAKVSGKPISGNRPARTSNENQLEDNSLATTAGDGVMTWVNTTANAGPNDGRTATNWLDGLGGTGLPANSDNMKFLPHTTDVDLAGRPVSYDLLYGLDHDDVDLTSENIGRSYRGIIGDPINKFFFKINCTTGVGKVVVDSSSP